MPLEQILTDLRNLPFFAASPPLRTCSSQHWIISTSEQSTSRQIHIDEDTIEAAQLVLVEDELPLNHSFLTLI